MTYLDEARDLLSKGRLEASILVLKENVSDPDLHIEILSLESRYNSLQSKINAGIIDDEDAILENNRITNSVLVLIADLANPTQRQQRTATATGTGSGGSRFDPKWLIIGLLSLIIIAGGGYLLTQSADPPAAETTTAEPAPDEPEQSTTEPVPPTTTRPPAATPEEPPAPRPNERSTPPPPTRESETTPPPVADNTETAPPPVESAPADPCATISCLNGGRCVDGRCDCPPGYTGDRCQTRARMSGEDCLGFNPGQLQILSEGGQYILSDGRSRMMTFPNRDEATKTIELIRHYGIRGNCYAERPRPNLHYFVTGSGELPRGSFSGEDCIRIRDAQNLKARSYNENSWILADGSHVIFRTKSESETQMIQRIMQHYDPGYICYVGRPDPSVVYLRK
jgi:hypothetical protein